LTGNQFKAVEAEKAGLVSKVLPQAELLPAAMKLAEQIAEMSQPIVALCKEAVNKSASSFHSFFLPFFFLFFNFFFQLFFCFPHFLGYETTLQEGNNFEKRLFHSTFATVCLPVSLFSAFFQNSQF
jgi:enoyl-CoA hydratase